MVSDKKIFMGISHRSVSAVLYPRWPPLLKIEISSNGQNCSILNQKVPKLEVYKHNDELFNIYYEIFFKFHPPFFLICIIGQSRQKFKVHKKSAPGTDYVGKEMIDIKTLDSVMDDLSINEPNIYLKVDITAQKPRPQILAQLKPKYNL
jgi:hypothetical protein